MRSGCLALSFGMGALWMMSGGPIAASAFGQCEGWAPGAGLSFSNADFQAFTMFDPDGSGPAPSSLVVAGRPITFNGLPHLVFRWDGVSWSPLPLSLLSPTIANALAIFDLDGDGPNPPRLIVGGAFRPQTFPAGSENIVATDGAVMSAMGAGLNRPVNALLVFDADGDGPDAPRLYAAGEFTASGQRPTGCVAVWNGSAWDGVGSGLSFAVAALTTFDFDGDGPQPPRLVAAVPSGPRGVYVLDGASWNAVGSITNVESLDVFDLDGAGPNPPRLVAAGSFNQINGQFLRGQAYYDGTSWRTISPTTVASNLRPRRIKQIEIEGQPPRLFLAGRFRLSDMDPLNTYLAELINGVWTPIARGDYAGFINAMDVVTLPGETRPRILAAGSLLQTPGSTLTLSYIENDHLRPLHDWFSGRVSDMTVATINGEPSLIVAGGFSHVPGAPARAVARFDGRSWSSLGEVADGNGLKVTTFDPDGDGPAPEHIVVAGIFTSFAGIAANNIAMYDGKNWSAMGAGLDIYPPGFATFDADGGGPERPMLYAAFGNIPGGPGTQGFIYRWDGTNWEPLPDAFVSSNGPPQTLGLTTFDPDGDGPKSRQLVVIGNFNTVGGVSANHIAAYDGHGWSSFNLPNSVSLQSVFTWDRNNDGHEVIVVGGPFTSIGSINARGAAVWDGVSWSPLGAGFGRSKLPHTLPNYPYAFEVFNNELFATGNFNLAEGGPADFIARWNGKAWTPFGGGLGGAGTALKTLPAHGDRSAILNVAGFFQHVNGMPSALYARYGDIPCCPADRTQDNAVNSDDFFVFLDAFFANDFAADFNTDGAVTSQDFFDFLHAFFAGC